MQSAQLKLGTYGLMAAWGLLMLLSVAGKLRWDNRLLWLPAILMGASFCLAAASWPYEEQRAPVVVVALLALASLVVYATGYVFLFAFSIPAG